jgi:hypothetical protein
MIRRGNAKITSPVMLARSLADGNLPMLLFKYCQLASLKETKGRKEQVKMPTNFSKFGKAHPIKRNKIPLKPMKAKATVTPAIFVYILFAGDCSRIVEFVRKICEKPQDISFTFMKLKLYPEVKILNHKMKT